MRKLLFAIAALGLFAASCSKDEPIKQEATNNADLAYVAITVDTKSNSTRTSSELVGSAAENALNSLYLISFDASGNIVGVPGSSTFYNAITTGASATPEAVKISAAAKNLMVIANPGTKLLAAINTLNSTSTFATFNTAITSITVEDLVDGTKGFAMITSGDETGKNPGSAAPDNQILEPFVDIDGKMTLVTTTEAAAKAEAEQAANRVDVVLERISAKLEVKVNTTVSVLPAGASFDFSKWTVDAVNGTYFPFAEKTLGSTSHTAGSFYAFNFYTKDPNFSDNTGISYGVVNSQAPTWSYEPVLPHSGFYGWKNDGDNAYCVENTMAAAEQKFENATRLVIKGQYAPAGFTLGDDWFSFAGINYQTFADLQAAYATAGPNLKDACDNFFTKITTYFTNTGKTLANPAAADITDLTDADLAQVANGGEVVKGSKTENVVRWFQGSLSYYYYEIRHDNEADATMAFGKYGVVRNNWYKLTLNSVSGAGTPWYPDINNPGPGDPDPEDPIDEEAGYLGISVDVANWIVWETGFGI